MTIKNNTPIGIIILTLSTVLCLTHTLSAQNNSTESPYTRFGYGLISSARSTWSRAMGGTAIATRKSNIINTANPASYVAVDSQTFIFDMGVSFGMSHFNEGKNNDTRLLGNLEYITVLFPLTKWLAVSTGITPYSSVGYRFGTTGQVSNSNNLKYTETFQGSGNLSDIYFGLGVRPIKPLSLGVNVAYRFGTLAHQRNIDFAVSSTYNPYFYEILNLKAVNVEAGVQWAYNFSNNNETQLTIGATYSPSLPYHSTKTYRELIMQNNQVSGIIRNDSLTSNDAYRTSHNIGLGISYLHKNKLFVEADVKYSIWQDTFKDMSLFTPQNQLSLSLGASFIPKYTDRSIWNRMEYRLGINGSNAYFTIPITSNKRSGYLQGGIALGLGIPLVDRRSQLDITFDYQHLMPREKGMISENYLMVTLGLRFNEGWFRKLKLD